MCIPQLHRPRLGHWLCNRKHNFSKSTEWQVYESVQSSSCFPIFWRSKTSGADFSNDSWFWISCIWKDSSLLDYRMLKLADKHPWKQKGPRRAHRFHGVGDQVFHVNLHLQEWNAHLALLNRRNQPCAVHWVYCGVFVLQCPVRQLLEAKGWKLQTILQR